MSKKRRATQKPKPGQIIVVGLVIGAVILGGLLVSQQFSPGSGSALRDSDTAFSIATHVGQPALEFTAIGVDGQPYTFKPGDGRPKVIVFYMGFQ
jgi:cytochrome oxidase Cu insertion factor (SCO1/SenC/PrrC family)